MKAIARIIFLIIFLLLPAGPVLAQQQGHIQGRVVDATTKQPLIGANVLVIGTTTGAASDADGIYRIEGLDEEVYKLRVSYLGYADFIETNVLVVRGKTTFINEIQLASSPILNASVTVTPDVVVTPVSYQSLQREEIRRNPGTAGDVLRAIGSLPGVSTSEGEFSAMSVRGSGVYDNLILIDNIPFEKINHFEGGSSEQETQGGRFSVFTAGLIERATFYGGSFGPEYGRKGASVLDLQVKEGNTESATINGSYDLLGLEVNYDGPTYLLDNTSLVLNFPDYDSKRALRVAKQEEFGDPTMADVIAKTTTHINKNNKLTLLGIYSTDRLIRAPRNILKADDLVENDIWDIDETRRLLDATLRTLTGQRSVLSNTFFYRKNDRFRSIGYVWADDLAGQVPETIAGLGARADVGVQEQEEQEFGWKSSFQYATESGGSLHAGVDLYTIDLDYSYTQNGQDTLYQFTPNDLAFNPDQKYVVVNPADVNYQFDGAAAHVAAYASYDYTAGRFSLTPGIRYAYNGFNKDSRISPKLQVRYQLTDKSTLNFATGIYHQTPLNRYVVLDPANRSLEEEQSTHFILGYNHVLRNDFRFTLEGYYKSMDNLITTSTVGTRLNNNGDGWASGFDVILLKRFTNRYYGQVSYSFTASKLNDNDGLGEYNAPYNQPHNFAVLFGYELSKEWFISGRWKYAVGRPKDQYILHENVLNDLSRMRYAKEITARNADRIPDFHVLSIRVDYRKQFGRFALITFFDLDNLYNRYNTYEDRFSELTGQEKGLGLGFAGNAGFKIEF